MHPPARHQKGVSCPQRGTHKVSNPKGVASLSRTRQASSVETDMGIEIEGLKGADRTVTISKPVPNVILALVAGIHSRERPTISAFSGKASGMDLCDKHRDDAGDYNEPEYTSAASRE
jgi:hypothetical protein